MPEEGREGHLLPGRFFKLKIKELCLTSFGKSFTRQVLKTEANVAQVFQELLTYLGTHQNMLSLRLFRLRYSHRTQLHKVLCVYSYMCTMPLCKEMHTNTFHLDKESSVYS